MLRGLPGLLLLLLLLLVLVVVVVVVVVVRLLARLVTVLLHPSMVHFTVQNRSDMLPPEEHKHASVRATPKKNVTQTWVVYFLSHVVTQCQILGYL